jgi:hypothetical protein
MGGPDDDALDERGREPVAAVCRDSLSNLLLPPALAAAASAAEPARFAALVDALAAEWASAPEGDLARVDASLKWVSLVNWCAPPPPPRALCGRRG